MFTIRPIFYWFNFTIHNCINCATGMCFRSLCNSGCCYKELVQSHNNNTCTCTPTMNAHKTYVRTGETLNVVYFFSIKEFKISQLLQCNHTQIQQTTVTFDRKVSSKQHIVLSISLYNFILHLLLCFCFILLSAKHCFNSVTNNSSFNIICIK